MRDDVAQRFTEPDCRDYRGVKYPRCHKKVRKTDADGNPVEDSKHARVLVGEYDTHNPGKDYMFVRRLLVGNVGRPWDDVYSELCQQADARSFVGHELRKAVEWMVETNCYFDADGTLRDHHDYKVGDMFWRARLYVHPETKTLEKIDTFRRYRRPATTQKVFELDGTNYHWHGGQWYRVEMQTFKRPGYFIADAPPGADAFNAHTDPSPKDQYGYRRFYWHTALSEKYGPAPEGDGWYCKKKEAAGKKEIKALKKKYGIK
jgi:hypothetical protein